MISDFSDDFSKQPGPVFFFFALNCTCLDNHLVYSDTNVRINFHVLGFGSLFLESRIFEL